MGSENGEHSKPRGRDHNDRAGLQLIETPDSQSLSSISFEGNVPISAVDEVLRMGGNQRQGVLRIAAHFMLSAGDDAAFMQNEYRWGGMGLQVDGKQYSVWFDEDGLKIAAGEEARFKEDALTLTWEQAAGRTKELLSAGAFAPQVVLDQALLNERSELAASLWYLRQDTDGEFFMDDLLFEGGFPASTERIAGMLANEGFLSDTLQGLGNFVMEYEENRNLLRFPFHNPEEILQRLSSLTAEPVVFPQSQIEGMRENVDFITEDEINQFLRRGGSYSGSRLAAYSYFIQNHTDKEKADYLKESYGTGGHSHAISRADNSHADYDAKGIRLTRGSYQNEPYNTTVNLNWANAAKRTEKLILTGRYLEPQDADHFADYEKSVLSQRIASFYYNRSTASLELPEGITSLDVANAVRMKLDDKDWVSGAVQDMSSILSGMEESDRNYEAMQNTFADMVAFRDGDYSLFRPSREMEEKAKANGISLSLEAAAEGRNLAEMVPVYAYPESAAVYLPDGVYVVEENNGNSIFLRNQEYPLFTYTYDISELNERVGEDIRNAHLIVDWVEKKEPEITQEVPANENMREDNAEEKSDEQSEIGVKEEAPEREEKRDDSVIDQPPVLDAANEAEYEKLRQKYKVNVLIGFEHDGYFEFYGDDAHTVSEILGSHIRTKQLESGDSMDVTGFRAETWVANGKKIWSKGQSLVLMEQSEDGSHQIMLEYDGKDYLPIGMEMEIEGRQFQIDAVDFQADKVSLRDLTFQGTSGFPIFRNESTAYVRSFVEEQQTFDFSLPEEELETAQETIQESTAVHEPANFHITDMDLGAGGAKAKFRRNMDAIHLLKELEASGRNASPEEQEILSQYVGWGGLPDAFDESKPNWANEFTELKDALTADEYMAARASTLNAHYTSPTVIKAMYDTLGNLGFQGGNILEPSMGVGNFFGMLPEGMQDSRLYGVELDSITGRIAKQLYQKADITVDGFEKTDYPNDFFDVVIGNVPFGNYKVPDKKYDRLNFQIHDYFLAKSLDQARPGGVVAVITSAGTMDKQNPSVRKYLAERANLLGAVRLPNNAFSRNAGTDVVADILFLQKRDAPTTEMPEWVQLGKSEQGYTINQYFASHPEMVLGELTEENTQYGKLECTVKPIPGTDLGEQLAEAMQHIQGTMEQVQMPDTDLEEDTVSIPADPSVKNFSYTVVDGDVYYRENSVMNKVNLPAATAERVKGMVAIRDCTRELIDCQMNEGSDGEIAALQGKLNVLYDNFTAKYGIISSTANKRAFNQDNSYCLLCSLEVVDEQGNLERKADMFSRRTIKKAEAVTHVDTSSEALAVSLGERAGVDLPFMEELTGKPQNEILEELHGVIFKNPLTERYETADEYLSGNVRQKLETARTFAENNPD
ncbi:MAG: hypothetical protein LUE92_11290, partial [Clostridiales bacterium]|nr:hypothetical protein [Clostridiales bacterium]